MTIASPQLPGLQTDLFIAGQWTPASSEKQFAVENPATCETIAYVADGTPEDAQRAIEVAGAAQAAWGRTSPRFRADILRKAYEIILSRADELAAIMTAEMGKPLAEAKGEVAYGAEFFRWFSEAAARIGGDATTTVDGNKPHPRDQGTGRPVRPRHTMELSARHGHAQDRHCDRSRVHNGLQACRAHPADVPCARVDPPRGRTARWRPQRCHDFRSLPGGQCLDVQRHRTES